jgi:ATP-dependent exoDNAse (exonuclease V) beta subunit
MHEYLALVDLTRRAVDDELLVALPEAEALRDMAAAYHVSALPLRLSRARHLHREIPLAFVDAGRQVHGIVDLIVEEADGGITVLDWKTDRVTAGQAPTQAECYREQLEIYGRGVQQALGLAAAPRLELCFLRCGVTVRLG